MLDLRDTVVPKSDQLNADDLVGGPRTIRVTKVSKAGNAEQPIAIDYEGSNGRPYKPCKTMRRLLVELWGFDGEKFVGRSMTLVRDPQVKWGGVEVGGIRISHMSDIPADTQTSVTLTKGKRAPFKVLKLEASTAKPPARPTVRTITKAIAACIDEAAIVDVLARAANYDWSEDDQASIDKAAADMRSALGEAAAE